MLGAMVLFGLLYWLYHRSRLNLRYGQLFAVWVAWYGFQRFFIDFTRLALEVDGDRTLGAFTWSQWTGLVAGIAGIAGLLWLGRINPNRESRERSAIRRRHHYAPDGLREYWKPPYKGVRPLARNSQSRWSSTSEPRKGSFFSTFLGSRTPGGVVRTPRAG